MSIDDQDLVLDATGPLVLARDALRIVHRLAEHADRLDDDPLSLVDGRHQRLAAAQRAYTQHATACALVALAGDARRIADRLEGRGTSGTEGECCATLRHRPSDHCATYPASPNRAARPRGGLIPVEAADQQPHYPDVTVQLPAAGADRKAIIAGIERAPRTAGVQRAEVKRFVREAGAADSYDQLLRICQGWVTVLVDPQHG